MDRNFIIDGVGRVVSPGDRVIVRQVVLGDNHGPGVLVGISSEDSVRVRLDCGIEGEFLTVRMMREDDDERAGGEPLWLWR